MDVADSPFPILSHFVLSQQFNKWCKVIRANRRNVEWKDIVVRHSASDGHNRCSVAWKPWQVTQNRVFMFLKFCYSSAIISFFRLFISFKCHFANYKYTDKMGWTARAWWKMHPGAFFDAQLRYKMKCHTNNTQILIRHNHSSYIQEMMMAKIWDWKKKKNTPSRTSWNNREIK